MKTLLLTLLILSCTKDDLCTCSAYEIQLIEVDGCLKNDTISSYDFPGDCAKHNTYIGDISYRVEYKCKE